MVKFYVVIQSRSFLHHAVDMHSLCEYYDLYDLRLPPRADRLNSSKISNFSFIKLTPGFLCEPDLVGIRDWSFNLTVDEESELTDSGKLEHRQLGQRFRQRLPSLIGLFSNESYQVLSMFKGCSCLIEGKLLCSGTVW